MSDGLAFLQNFLERMLEPHGTTAEFCRVTGISRNTVKSWLRGDTSPDVRELQKIADFFKVDPWELIMPEGGTWLLASCQPTVKSLAKIIDDQEHRLHDLQKDLAERDARIKDLEAKLAERENTIKELKAKLAQIDADRPADLTGIPGDILKLLAEAPEDTDWEFIKTSIKAAFGRDKTKAKAKKPQEDAG